MRISVFVIEVVRTLDELIMYGVRYVRYWYVAVTTVPCPRDVKLIECKLGRPVLPCPRDVKLIECKLGHSAVPCPRDVKLIECKNSVVLCPRDVKSIECNKLGRLVTQYVHLFATAKRTVCCVTSP